MLKNVEKLCQSQKESSNPGHNLGWFLLNHSGCPQYTVTQLRAYLAAAEQDLRDEQSFQEMAIQAMREEDSASE